MYQLGRSLHLEIMIESGGVAKLGISFYCLGVLGLALPCRAAVE